MKEVTNIEEFEKLSKQERFVFIGKSKSCAVCNPVQEKLIVMLEEFNTNGYFGYIENLPLIRGQYTIFTAPTILIFSYGKEVLRESGFIKFGNIKKVLEMS